MLKALAAAGIGHTVFARALAAQAAAADSVVTPEMIRQAAWIAGIDFTEDERKLMATGVAGMIDSFEQIRKVELDNSVAPAIRFDAMPAQGIQPPDTPGRSVRDRMLCVLASQAPPDSALSLAFSDIASLASALRTGVVSAERLTRLALDRLAAFDPVLACVISRLEARALEQAARADDELAAGRDRGPLHGIPWGAKDLLAVRGARTTWGAKPFEQQVIDDTATVAERLEAAGAPLVAKLSLGALAWGDVWFGGQTKNPWKPTQGSSGSSAGPAAAVAAGLVPFALGTETLGSIVSPSTRCGTSGLRPTFGRVSRHGAMALSWSMDKIGPIARSVADCALVLDKIHGADGRDATAVDRPFVWPFDGDPQALRVGYVPALFERDRGAEIEDEARAANARAWQAQDLAVLDTLRTLGFTLHPITLPDSYPLGALRFILTAEAACAFDALTRSGRDEQLVRQIERAWPNVFRQGQLIPAVEYLRANRIRSLLMRDMQGIFEQVEVYVTPTFAGSNLLLTNLTGHPQAVVPDGFRADGTPFSITFTGDLFGESALCAVAHAFQQATDFHRRRPPLADAPRPAV